MPDRPRPFAITLDPDSSLANRTGNWRTQRPEYVARTPPCSHACPAGEDIQRWLYHAESGHYERAWRVLTEDNPFPAIHGRVCYHPCEDACNRGQMDEAVGIHCVERFLGDHANEKGWRFEAPERTTGRRVLVVGGGPSGLSAAYQLRKRGHEVTIRDAEADPGGMMRYGIPSYRLPRDVMNAEIDRVLEMGVGWEPNHRVSDLEAEMQAGDFDAVFVAVGAHLSKRVEIPAADASRVYDALDVLRRSAAGEKLQIGRRVAVYGGGNTAMDAARTAKRLGAEPVIVYRRDPEHMPAHAEELEQALDEGVQAHWLRTIAGTGAEGLKLEKMELDENGRPQPTGEYEMLPADAVVLALGQKADTSFLREIPEVEVAEDGTVQVDENLMTGRPGVFAGGDMVPAERTVTVGVGHGKQAARCIDAYLRDERPEREPEAELATFEKLNSWYFTDAPRSREPELARARRTSTFEEVVGGLDENNALFEARRCLSCGNCFACDNCYGVCPDNAVIKHADGTYQIDYDYCKGCGMCAEECPCGAIRMVEEEV